MKPWAVICEAHARSSVLCSPCATHARIRISLKVGHIKAQRHQLLPRTACTEESGLFCTVLTRSASLGQSACSGIRHPRFWGTTPCGRGRAIGGPLERRQRKIHYDEMVPQTGMHASASSPESENMRTSMSVKGLPVSLLVAWMSRSRKLPGLHPDRMLTSWLPPLAVPLAAPFAAASRARVSLISSAHRARSLRRACDGRRTHVVHSARYWQPAW